MRAFYQPGDFDGDACCKSILCRDKELTAMIRGLLILIAVGFIPGLFGCRSNGLSTASTSSNSVPLYGSKTASGQDARTFAQNPKSGVGSKSGAFSKSKPYDMRTADVKNAGWENRQSARVPTVQPARHASDPDPEIPAGEAGAAQPQGNAFTRMLTGKKEPGKRMPLPLADGQSAQPTNDELFSGF